MTSPPLVAVQRGPWILSSNWPTLTLRLICVTGTRRSRHFALRQTGIGWRFPARLKKLERSNLLEASRHGRSPARLGLHRTIRPCAGSRLPSELPEARCAALRVASERRDLEQNDAHLFLFASRAGQFARDGEFTADPLEQRRRPIDRCRWSQATCRRIDSLVVVPLRHRPAGHELILRLTDRDASR